MSVLGEFRQAIQLQQSKDDEAYEELIALPIDERVAKGVTMDNLRVEFEFREDIPNRWSPVLDFPLKFIRSAKIFCDNNISKFREGAQVFLSNGNLKFKMDIIKDSIDIFMLAPSDFDVKDCYIDTENYNENHWEINIVKTSVTLKLLSATASNLELDSTRLNRIEKLLSGNLINSFSNKINYDQLNESQNSAVEKSVSCSDFHLILGPPGTGKTKTIGHIAKILVDSGKNVFITAPTHTAINNCLNALSEEVRDASKIIKIGEKYQAAEILENEYITRKTRLPIESYDKNENLSHDGIIIGGTPYCFCYPASKRLNNWEFDIALIDEAAQMSIPMAVSVMSKTDKFIFVGDHRQLDPIMPARTGLSMFTHSIFRTLAGKYNDEMSLLKISYRLNENLIRIPNELFYNNALISDSSLPIHNEHLESKLYDKVLNSEDSKVLYLHKEFDSQGRSPYEAKIVAGLVKDLLSNGVDFRDIGILTPYRAQVREIKKALNTILGNIDSEAASSLFIDTVDRMQGQERDYIIYSMSNSHPLESKRRLDFFYSPNRLNVAITRAIKKCIVIANYKVFDIIDDELVDVEEFEQLKPSLDIFKEYHKLSTKVEEIIEENDW
jgi:DNA replication ATP-dependent helicase Dna2